MSYNFLHDDAFDGSLLLLPTLHKAIWAYIVAKAKPHSSAEGGGAVRLVPRLMAVYFSDQSLEDIEEVIQTFCEPDTESRTDLCEGRRLLPMGRNLYAIPTYGTHAGSRLARDAERKRREYQNAKEAKASRTVTETAGDSRTVTEHVADHVAEVNRTPPIRRGGGLITSSLDYDRLTQKNAFVGAVLRVPHVLHTELLAKSGSGRSVELLAWYARLDAELEASGQGTGDVFQWLRPRHQVFVVAQGWVAAAPDPKAATKAAARAKNDADLLTRLQAVAAKGAK